MSRKPNPVWNPLMDAAKDFVDHMHDPLPPAVLLRDTPEDVERLALALHAKLAPDYPHTRPAHPELHPGLSCWCERDARAIIERLRGER